MVIVVIGIIAGIVLNTVSSAQKKARDTKRRTDLSVLSKAMVTFTVDTGLLPIQTGKGHDIDIDGTCDGTGWVNNGDNGESGYPCGSIRQFLVDEGYVSGKAAEPIKETGNGSYMFYNCGNINIPEYYGFFAKLEVPSSQDGIAFQKWKDDGCKGTPVNPTYQMNYVHTFKAAN